MLLLGDNLDSTHIRLEDVWNHNGSVLLLIGLKKCNNRPGQGQTRAIQGVYKSQLSILVTKTNINASCLKVFKITAGRNLQEFAYTWRPYLNIIALCCRKAHISRRKFCDPVFKSQELEYPFCITQ